MMPHMLSREKYYIIEMGNIALGFYIAKTLHPHITTPSPHNSNKSFNKLIAYINPHITSGGWTLHIMYD